MNEPFEVRTQQPTHRCLKCATPVTDPHGHYYAPLYGQSGFYCHPCFQSVASSAG